MFFTQRISKSSLWLCLALLFFSMLSSTIIVPLVKDIVKDSLGGKNIDAALFLSLAMAASFCFAPLAGYLSDRLQNRQKIIALFALLNALCFLALAYAQSLETLLVLRFMEGGVSAFVVGLLIASIADHEHSKKLQKPFQKKGLLTGFAAMLLTLGAGLGFPLAALGRKEPLLVFYTAAAIMLCIGCIAFFLLRDAPLAPLQERDSAIAPGARTSPSFLHYCRRTLALEPYLLLPAFYTFIDRFTAGFFVSSFNIHLRENLAMDAGKAGMALGLVMIPMSLLAYPTMKLSQRVGILPLILLGSAVNGLALFFLGNIRDSGWLYALLILSGVGAGLMSAPTMAFATLIAPKGFRATAMSIFLGCGSFGFMLGPMCFSFLESLFLSYSAWITKKEVFFYLSAVAGSMQIMIVIGTLLFYRSLRTKLKEKISTKAES